MNNKMIIMIFILIPIPCIIIKAVICFRVIPRPKFNLFCIKLDDTLKLKFMLF